MIRRLFLAAVLFAGCSMPTPSRPGAGHGHGRARVILFASSDAEARRIEAGFPLPVAERSRFERERNTEWNRHKWGLVDHGSTPLVVVTRPSGRIEYRGPYDPGLVFDAVRRATD